MLEVALQLEETAGVTRVEEPIVSGVPLPRGGCHDVSALRLVDEQGREIPAHFSVANRWWRDRSVKWVHMDLQRSLARGARETIYLRLGELKASKTLGDDVPGALRVDESADSISVTTGPLRFRVAKSGFNLFDQVWLDETGKAQFDDAHAMLGARPRGARVRQGSLTAWAHADADSQVTIEESNPFRVVLRAEGRHLDHDGRSLTDSITRITAYRGKPYVTISHVFLVRQGDTMADYLSLQDVGLVLPVNVSPGEGDISYRFGGSEETHRGTLSRQETTSLHQFSSDGYAVYSARNEEWWEGWRMAPEARGSGHSSRTGWVDLLSGEVGVAVGVRYFWQMYPKLLRVGADGDIVVGLYPDTRYEKPLLVYPGMARTHELTVLFHRGATDEELYGLMAAAQDPLLAVAPPKWYCRDTLAFGFLPEADPDLYDARYRAVVDAFEHRFWDSFQHILTRRDTREGLPPGVDEYGIINFGDGFQHERDGTRYWSDNYYDFPHALLLQFARTGRREYLDTAREYARHLGDVDITCYDPAPELIGGPRVCPAIDHVLAYYNGEAQTSLSFNFHKNQSMFELWYLTADRRFLETALLSADFVMTQHGVNPGEPRSAGHAYISLHAAWEATGRQEYVDRGHDFWQRVAEYQDEHGGGFPHSWSFQVGLAAEGLRDWYILTADPEVLARIQRAMDWMIDAYGDSEKGFRDPTAYTGFVGLGMCYEITGDERYLDPALRHAEHYLGTSYGTRVKDYGMAFRSSPYFLWWLQRESGPTLGTR
jgi:hypothetical protein